MTAVPILKYQMYRLFYWIPLVASADIYTLALLLLRCNYFCTHYKIISSLRGAISYFQIVVFHCFFLFYNLANCGSPSQPTNGIIIPYSSTTEGARVIFVCRNIYHNTFREDNYTVSTCSKQGNWEPNPGNFCAITAGYY